MLKIKSVTIEGMHNVDHKTYDLSDVNYLHGMNGAGKSTVLQAIQLALLGYIPGMNKTKETILSNSNNHTMAVTVVITGGKEPITVQRIYTQTKKGTTTTVNIEPDGLEIGDILSQMELPIFNFKDFTNMTSNKLKDWFIDFLPSVESKLNWNKVLSEEVKLLGTDQEGNIKEACAEFDTYKDMKAADQVRQANQYFKNKISIAKTEISRLDSTIKSLLFYDDVDALESVDDLKDKVSQLQGTKISVLANNNALKLYQDLKTQLEALNVDENSQDKIKLLEGYISNETTLIEEGTNRLYSIAAEVDTIKEEIATLKVDIAAKDRIIKTGGLCSYTGEKCPSIVQMIEELKAQRSESQTTCDTLSAKLQSLTKDQVNTQTKIQTLRSNIARYTNELNDIQLAQARYESLTEQLNRIDVANLVTQDISEIDKQIQECTSTITKLLANEKFSEMSESLAKEKYLFEIDLAAYKAWEKLTSVNGLQTIISNEPFVILGQDIDKFLKPLFGENVSAEFNLETRANSFSFGIRRGDQYIPYDLLSSGEKCMFTLAMMITLISQSTDDLRVIMIDDMFDNLDDSNANKIIKAISKVKGIQFIVAGVKGIEAVTAEQLIEVK